MSKFSWEWLGRIADLWSLTEPVRKFLAWILFLGGSLVTTILAWVDLPLWQVAVIGLSFVLALLATAYVGVRIGRELSLSSRSNYLPPIEHEPEDRKHDLPPPVSPQVSHRDEMNRRGILALVDAHVRHFYPAAQVVMVRLLGGLENSGDAKYQTIALLVRHCALRPCNETFQKLSLAVVSPDEETVEGLRQKLWEFFEAYQKLLCWTNHIAHHASISLSGDAHNAWQENHRQFYKRFRELIASDRDFFQLPEHLREQWRDI
jgi:hypothetical protein